MNAATLGRRIIVSGPSGSGKSTMGRNLGELLDLPVVELDSIFHRDNWEPTPLDEFREAVTARLDGHGDGWICDGNYGTVRDIVLPRADTVVWLRLPFRVVYTRLVKRTLRRMCTRELLWGRNRESFRLSFLSRDSILLWGITHWRPHHRNFEDALANIPHKADVHILRSPREVTEFVDSLASDVARAPAR